MHQKYKTVKLTTEHQMKGILSRTQSWDTFLNMFHRAKTRQHTSKINDLSALRFYNRR